MTLVRVKGFKIFRDRHGKARCYHRATGAAVDLASAPMGTPEFFAECARITSSLMKAAEPKPGTLGLLMKAYRASPVFADLQPRTRQDYHRLMDFLKPIQDTAIVRIDPPFVARLRDKAAEKRGRRWGTYIKQFVSLLFAWGLEQGYSAVNPARGIKGVPRDKSRPEANRPWSDAERDAVMAALPSHMRLPVSLMMFCGLDPGDTMKLPRSAIAGGKLNTKRHKTAEPVWFPLPDGVLRELSAGPSHSAVTVCASSKGMPWTVSGFRASWRTVRQRLEQSGAVRPGLTLKGLRHTVATILAEMGYDERSIADMLGQKTTEMARHYSRRADKSRKMTGVIESFDAEVNRRRTKVVKPD